MSAVEDVLIPYVPIVHLVDLPFPVSVNRLYRKGKNLVYKSAEAKTWIIKADNLWLSQKRGIPRCIGGPFSAWIELAIGMGRGDGDNRVKIVLDWAQRIGLISNDKNARRTTVEWVERHIAPHGCKLSLTEIA
jgi:Holliday junction resolvase RusA-like endonuclease